MLIGRIVAAAILALCTAGFFLPEWFGLPLRKISLGFQFSTHIVVAVLVLASVWLFGRWYCSFLCPAGIVQQAFSRLGGWLRLRRLHYTKPPYLLPRLLAVAATLLLGTAAVANWLDPIGLFGRTVNNIATLPELTSSDWFVIATVIASASILIIVPLFRGRWFCDSLCPVGALFCLTGNKRTVQLDAAVCVSCGKCEKVCPVRCQNAAEKRMDSERCVLCFSCVPACPVSALSYNRTGPKPERRRFFHKTIAALAGGLFFFARPLYARLAVLPAGEAPPLPPGSGRPESHAQQCVSCQSCVPACPVGIIRPQSPDMRPVLNYDYGYCQYNCNACNRSCPAGAFRPLSLEEKQRTRLADTTLYLNRCVVVTRGTECGACAEVCPTHAVRMVEQGAGLPTIPDFDQAYCIGCGACYHVCPAEPRAFTLTGVVEQTLTLGVRPGGHATSAPALPVSDDGITDFPF